jgi:hypothetical protein
MSHLIAFFGVSELTLLSVHLWSGSPGPGPLPKNSHENRFGFFGGGFAMRITP